MLISAAIAGAAGYFFAKAAIEKDDFQRSIQLIQNDDDAYWCGQAKGQIVPANDGSKHCAIHMPNYQVPEQAE